MVKKTMLRGICVVFTTGWSWRKSVFQESRHKLVLFWCKVYSACRPPVCLFAYPLSWSTSPHCISWQLLHPLQKYTYVLSSSHVWYLIGNPVGDTKFTCQWYETPTIVKFTCQWCETPTIVAMSWNIIDFWLSWNIMHFYYSKSNHPKFHQIYREKYY